MYRSIRSTITVLLALAPALSAFSAIINAPQTTGARTRQPLSGISVRTPGYKAAVPANRGAQSVFLRNEDGTSLGRSRYVWFTDQRVLVPVSAYEKMGMNVQRDFRSQRVRITTPHTNQGFTFAVGQRTVQEPDTAASEDAVVRYERPVLTIRQGEFYIAPMALKQYFGTLIDTKWDRQKRTVTLQRTHEMNRLLRFMPKS